MYVELIMLIENFLRHPGVSYQIARRGQGFFSDVAFLGINRGAVAHVRAGWLTTLLILEVTFEDAMYARHD